MTFFLLTILISSVTSVGEQDAFVEVTMRFPTEYATYEACAERGLELIGEYDGQGEVTSREFSCDEGIKPEEL